MAHEGGHLRGFAVIRVIRDFGYPLGWLWLVQGDSWRYITSCSAEYSFIGNLLLWRISRINLERAGVLMWHMHLKKPVERGRDSVTICHGEKGEFTDLSTLMHETLKVFPTLVLEASPYSCTHHLLSHFPATCRYNVCVCWGGGGRGGQSAGPENCPSLPYLGQHCHHI